MDDILTWWEIPSIVHFCNVFQHVCKDICPVNIDEFEDAIEENSTLLMDMAIRFIKICGFYDPNTKKWWKFMQNLFEKKRVEYNIECSLEFVTYFNDLTRKLKVKSLYILCHMILDVPYIQRNISYNPKLWHTFNVKPIGYDLNYSVYWYFGTTKLYREDFSDAINLSANSSMLHDTILSSLSNSPNLSNIDIQRRLLTKPYPSGILGRGKWSVICDDNDSWHSLVTITQYSQSKVVRILHKSICNIITNLPQVKRKKLHYKYIDSSLQSKSELQNIYTRRLRSMFVNVDKNSRLLKNVDISKETSQNIEVSQAKQHNDLFSQLDKTKNIENVCDQNTDQNQTSYFTRNKRKQITLKNETEIELNFIKYSPKLS